MTGKVAELKDSWDLEDIRKSIKEILGNESYASVPAIKQLCQSIANKG